MVCGGRRWEYHHWKSEAASGGCERSVGSGDRDAASGAHATGGGTVKLNGGVGGS